MESQIPLQVVNGVSDKLKVIKEIIKQSYINRSQHKYDPEWETIKNRINKLCFNNVDINNKLAFTTAYELAIQCLEPLHYWYFKYFKVDKREGLTNITVSVPISNSIIEDTIDLVLLDEKYKAVPLIFNEYNRPFDTIHNDLRIKGLMWLLDKELGTSNSSLLEYLEVNLHSVSIYRSYLQSKSLLKIDTYLEHIVKGIENKAFYPSINAQCNECSFQAICTI